MKLPILSLSFFLLSTSAALAVPVTVTLGVKLPFNDKAKCESDLKALQELAKSVGGANSGEDIAPITDVEAYCLEKFPPPPPPSQPKAKKVDEPGNPEAPNDKPAESGGNGSSPPPPPEAKAPVGGRCSLEANVAWAGIRDDGLHNDLYWANHQRSLGSPSEVEGCVELCDATGQKGFCTFYRTVDGMHNNCTFMWDLDPGVYKKIDAPPNAKSHYTWGGECN